MKKSNLFRGLAALLILVLCLTSFGSKLAFDREGDVNLFMGTLPPTTAVTDDTNYYASDYDSMEDMRAALSEHIIRTQEEGSVLLRNENDALPFSTGDAVTLFGYAAATPVYHGGSGGPSNTGINLYEALVAEGVRVNETVYTAIQNAGGTRTKTGLIGEIDVSAYAGTESSYASDYNDVAIYVMSRYGGEEGDLNHGLQGDWEEGPEGVAELSLHQEEIDTLNLIKDSGKFKKIVVVLNSGYAMELGDLPEYGVDAILWIGYPGGEGMTGVAKVLTGQSDVSGRNVITYATDSLSSAAMQNAGDFTFSNLTGLYKNKYLVYAEGIYVGYKYYETRYQDQVLGLYNADSAKGAYASEAGWNYADEMVYGFGEGGSYADFTQELQSVTWDRETHTVEAVVKVTNNGGFDGTSKDVVQLYVQLPWAEGQTEKSAIQLVDFEKTSALAAGETETVTLSFSDYLLAAYDEEAVNGADTSKMGCYVFDEGDYYFAIGNGAHDALNNVLAAKGATGMTDAEGNGVSGDAAKAHKETLSEQDNTTWAVSPYTGVVVSNLFEDRDINYFIDGAVTYLTRADWNTFPDTVESLTATDEIQDLMENFQYETPADAPDVSSFLYKQDNGLSFIDMKDVPFDDDETWNSFIDQLAVTELTQIVGDKMAMDAIASVGFPAYAGGDGPDGHQSGVLFNAEMIASSSFSKEILEERGKFFAEESYWIGFRQIYAPGGNIHRTPYSGRNFEYYSEDSMMSYLCGEVQTKAMAERGLVGTFKHFCGNDQETNRHGVATFMTEQTYREVCLKGFEGGLQKDHGMGTMTAYNRIGCIPTASDEATMTNVLREEWGFTGINMTDSSKDASTYMGTADAIAAGTTQFNNDGNRSAEATSLLTKNRDGYIWSCLRKGAKYYFYTMSRSNLINGLTQEQEVEDFTPWWQPALIGLNAVIAAGALALLALYVVNLRKEKKEETKVEVIS